ncbi:hypothetical protein GCM10010123_18620 [Pilimelia anulata]|uniref:Uncharacterized protein n=1 Tax=Pilimelia anulata TaxID=53371 RepID=A0A8J3F8R6_9ACTN|nr:hypothetical protein GCM10010123_18620 [Pilimelia anulata]
MRGFANVVDPTAAELRAWAHDPDSVPISELPEDFDLLVTGDRLVGTLFALALDPTCPARRFALHCLYIYAADAIRTEFRHHPRRRLRRLVEQAEARGDTVMLTWAHNCRVLLVRPELYTYRDWCAGGLVREPREIA